MNAVDPKIVLVEDDEDGRTMLAALLRARGFAVTVASDGLTGLAQIIDVVPDIALIDIGLPMMSGLEICRQVRERYGRDAIRLIALTGYGQESDRRAVFDAGFDHHFVKPIDANALERALAGEINRGSP